MFHFPTDTIRWGALGSATITESSLAPAVAADPRNRLDAIGSRSLDSARALADRVGAPRAYGSYDELIADPDIDIIYNPLPNSLHCEWTVKALEAGKHVLCEKPLALSAMEVRRMSAAARRANKLLVEGFMWRYHPRVRRVLELAARTIGPLRLVRVAYTYDLAANYGGDKALALERDIRLSPAMGGGALGDVGSYTINGLRTYAGGRALRVTSQLLAEENGVDMRFSGEVLFDNGVLGQFFVAMDVPGGAVIDLTGDRGRVRLPNAFRTTEAWGESVIELIDQSGTVTRETIPYLDQFALEVSGISAVLLDGAHTVVSNEDSLDNALLMDAIRRSWTAGPVDL